MLQMLDALKQKKFSLQTFFFIFYRYKILFLDVLFPLGIKKVAFIDADQIVRTDIQELFDLDLEGAPYGYTPFCSDRTEMDGFRYVREA